MNFDFIPQIETFQLGPVTIYVWGLMVSVGIIAGFIIALIEGKRKSVNLDHITSLALYMLIGAIVGSRLFYVVVHIKDFENFLDVFKIWQGGLIFYGGFIGAIIPAWIYVRKYKLNFWQIADIFALALALGIFIGRIGCVLIQDHMGVVTNFFMAQNYMGEMRHNTAIYSSLNGLFMFIILWFLKKRIKVDGILFLIFTLEYAVSRYFIDQLRAFDLRWYGLTGSQWICIVMFLVAAYFLWWKLRRKKNNQN